mgnify:CR=1 FL=1
MSRESETTDDRQPNSVPDTTEVLILGGGAGGYVTAVRAAQLGLDVTIVERDAYGGTCLNTGCIPSKALIHGADVAHEATNAEQFGITAEVETDLGQLLDWKDGVVDQLTGGVKQMCTANGVTLVDGEGRFVDDHRAAVVTNDEETTIDFEYAVVATGSRPIELPGFDFDGEHILASSDLLTLDYTPDSLLIVGAGYIGMELSMALSKLGVDITVVEMLDDVLPMYDDEISQVVRERAVDLGVAFRFGEAAADWEPTDGGIVVTTETEDGTTTDHAADAWGVGGAGLRTDETVILPAVEVVQRCGCFIWSERLGRRERVDTYAVCVVAGGSMLAHKALVGGGVPAVAITGEPAAIDGTWIPAAVFTDPEIASVGLTSEAADAAGYTPVVGRTSLMANGRAPTIDATDGFVRIVADEPTGRLLGAQIVAPTASELIGELTLAVEAGMNLDSITRTVHAHPTLSEAVAEAAADARGEGLHSH